MILSLLAFLSCANAFASADGNMHFDRALKPAEQAKLLPEYVRFVEERADRLPSAQDTERLRRLAAALADPTQGSFRVQNDGSEELVGHETQTIDDILAQAESEIAELKAVSAEVRRAQIGQTLAGFKGARDAGKISCQLGYFSAGRNAMDRIVKCTDDRSRAGRGNEEGSADQREFILSIDAKTLAPVGVISLEEYLAG